MNTGTFGNTGLNTGLGTSNPMTNTMFKPQTSGLTTGTTNTMFNPTGQTGQGTNPGLGMMGTNPLNTGGIGATSTGTTSGFNIGGLGNKPTTSFPTTNPLGGTAGMTTQQPLTNTGYGMVQPNITATIPNVNTQKKEIEKQEILHVLQNFLNSSNPSDQTNVFKYMIYNTISKGMENYIPTLQAYKAVTQVEEGVNNLNDYNLWIKALEKNPDPNLFYPFQLSSVQQMKSRIISNNVSLMQVLQHISENHNKASGIYEKINKEIETHVQISKNKLQEIKMRQFRLMSKIEIVAQKTNKANFNYENYNNLNNKLSSIKSVALDNMEKVSSLNRLTDVVIENEEELLKDFTKERLEKCFNCLVDMKKTMENNFSFLDRTQNMLSVIKRDFENIKKYGKP